MVVLKPHMAMLTAGLTDEIGNLAFLSTFE
jgi:hypothetical protein